MSQSACAEFFRKLDTDTALATEVTTALQGKEGTEAANAFVWVGAKHGYEFTAEEATLMYQQILATEEGELDEEALEHVAGGFLRY